MIHTEGKGGAFFNFEFELRPPGKPARSCREDQLMERAEFGYLHVAVACELSRDNNRVAFSEIKKLWVGYFPAA